MTRRAIPILLAAVLIGACGRLSSVPPLSVGPVQPAPETFQQLVTFVQARGYTPLEADPATGTLRVQANTSSRRGAYMFTLQCYREGWVSIIPNGPNVRRDGDVWLLPGSLREEYVDLGTALAQAMPRTSGGVR